MHLRSLGNRKIGLAYINTGVLHYGLAVLPPKEKAAGCVAVFMEASWRVAAGWESFLKAIAVDSTMYWCVFRVCVRARVCVCMCVYWGGSLFRAGFMQRREKVSTDRRTQGASAALCLHPCRLPSSVTVPALHRGLSYDTSPSVHTHHLLFSASEEEVLLLHIR